MHPHPAADDPEWMTIVDYSSTTAAFGQVPLSVVCLRNPGGFDGEQSSPDWDELTLLIIINFAESLVKRNGWLKW